MENKTFKKINQEKKTRETFEGLLYVLAFLVLIPILTTGCVMTPAEEAAVNAALASDVNAPKEQAPIPELAPQCFNERYIQPEAQITRKIDLLFVTDTSGSIIDERAEIADGIDDFIAELPTNIDLQVAVQLAHGSKSVWSQKLYDARGGPAVLSTEKMSVNQIRTYLKDKLSRPHTDYYADGGEESFYALLTLLEEKNLRQARTAKKFFREDAALVVIFVSDENEICYDYQPGEIPAPDLDGEIEKNAKIRDCQKEGRKINHQLVLEKLKALQGDRPLLIGGILYNNEATFVKGGENELGRGYLDLIRDSRGISIDMAGSHLNEGLAEIGQLASVKIQLLQDFTLAHSEVDSESIQASVDGIRVEHQYDPIAQSVHLEQAGSALSVVDLNYCLKTTVEDPVNWTDDPTAEPTLTPTPTPTPVSGGTTDPTPTPTPGELQDCPGGICDVIGV